MNGDRDDKTLTDGLMLRIDFSFMFLLVGDGKRRNSCILWPKSKKHLMGVGGRSLRESIAIKKLVNLRFVNDATGPLPTSGENTFPDASFLLPLIDASPANPPTSTVRTELLDLKNFDVADELMCRLTLPPGDFVVTPPFQGHNKNVKWHLKGRSRFLTDSVTYTRPLDPGRYQLEVEDEDEEKERHELIQVGNELHVRFIHMDRTPSGDSDEKRLKRMLERKGNVKLEEYAALYALMGDYSTANAKQWAIPESETELGVTAREFGTLSPIGVGVEQPICGGGSGGESD